MRGESSVILSEVRSVTGCIASPRLRVHDEELGVDRACGADAMVDGGLGTQ